MPLGDNSVLSENNQFRLPPTHHPRQPWTDFLFFFVARRSGSDSNDLAGALRAQRTGNIQNTNPGPKSHGSKRTNGRIKMNRYVSL